MSEFLSAGTSFVPLKSTESDSHTVGNHIPALNELIWKSKQREIITQDTQFFYAASYN